jgi:secreted PhoX family phosphatase
MDANATNDSLQEGYGPLVNDPEATLNLPEGFRYRVISSKGSLMTDGFLVPGAADGMATFPGPDGKIIIIRNHEVSQGDVEGGPFGARKELLSKISPDMVYDYGKGDSPCMGGTTTLVYNPVTEQVETEYLSLAGTIRNCAGGRTPWNSWITCEEDTSAPSKEREKWHGYAFEVPVSATPVLATPTPLLAMGRFNHEAVCVDPRSGIVYQTEDRGDGLLYRFIPDVKGKLQEGGKLQVLAIKDQPGFETRNWADLPGEKMMIGEKYEVEWLDIDGVDAPDDDLRYRGFAKGAARFARGEGIWFGENEFYFACTNGGRLEHGQIFRYKLSPNEGQLNEVEQPPTLEIFIEPNNTDLIESCDNLTIASHGDLVICEDKTTPRIVGVTPEGGIYHIAKNVGYKSEFAGATFSPDGKILFVNIQGPGLTIAITGPWDKRKGLII